MFKEVLNAVKKKEGKKANLNILIFPSMKEDFDKLCKNNSTTMTAMMLGFIEKSLKDNPDYKKLSIEELEIEELTLEHQLENAKVALNDFDDSDFDEEEIIKAKASIYTNIDFYTKQLSILSTEIYSDERKEERENNKKYKIGSLLSKKST